MAWNEAGDSAAVRFWRRVEKSDGCWIWTGHTSGGYGRIRVNGRREQAHRFSFELHLGPVPDGLVVDHVVCDNQRCVNPAHLKAVTQAVNVLRGQSPAAQQARRTHCFRGHALAGDNVRTRGRRRECRTCRNAARRARHAVNRDADNARKRELYRTAKAGV